MLDEHGQPLIQFNWRSNLKKSTEQLLGICLGIIADNKLNEKEILFLDTWLKENLSSARDWPGSVIAERVQKILTDGVISTEEREDLKDTLALIIGGNPNDSGAVSGMATRLPIDKVKKIKFRGSAFCLTGKFLYGPRKKCADIITDRGGEISETVTRDIDYLVIGTLSSRDWAHTSHGRKIERAVEYKRAGAIIMILSEENWTEHL